jgi:hypothetical protein
MRPKTTSEKIDFLVRNWIDGADVETIIEYAAEQLGKFYIDLGADLVDKLYLDELEERDEFEDCRVASTNSEHTWLINYHRRRV